MVTIFYSPLAQVYKAANIADSLYDLQKFIDDLIKTVESCEEGELTMLLGYKNEEPSNYFSRFHSDSTLFSSIFLEQWSIQILKQ